MVQLEGWGREAARAGKVLAGAQELEHKGGATAQHRERWEDSTPGECPVGAGVQDRTERHGTRPRIAQGPETVLFLGEGEAELPRTPGQCCQAWVLFWSQGRDGTG